MNCLSLGTLFIGDQFRARGVPIDIGESPLFVLIVSSMSLYAKAIFLLLYSAESFHEAMRSTRPSVRVKGPGRLSELPQDFGIELGYYINLSAIVRVQRRSSNVLGRNAGPFHQVGRESCSRPSI